MTTICSKCLAPSLNYIQDGHDDRGRKFKLYICGGCNNFTRDFNLTERQTVEEALREESHVSLSANGINARPTKQPEQMTLGLKIRVSD